MQRMTVVALLVMLLATACGGAADDMTEPTAEPSSAESDSSPVESEADTTMTTTATDSNAETGDETTPTTTEDGEEPVSQTPSLDDAVAFAVADLAEMVSADSAAITVVANEPVTWRDGSLGCPEPGMSYTQALVSGRRIVLEHDGVEYHYHAGRSGEPFYCATPTDPADSEATPIDQ
jgi:hypothetical protein